MAYFILRKTLIPLIKALFVRKIAGLENIPAKGPCILAVNHSSYIDPIILGALLPSYVQNNVYYIGMKPLEKYWINRIVLGKYLKTLFVNGVVSEAIEKLKQGSFIVIFPEGGRTPDGELQKPQGSGTAVIANAANAPVIPVAIEGTFELWPKYQRLPHIRKIVEINFCKKIYFRKKNPTRKQMEEFIKTIMQQIAQQLKKRYYY